VNTMWCVWRELGWGFHPGFVFNQAVGLSSRAPDWSEYSAMQSRNPLRPFVSIVGGLSCLLWAGGYGGACASMAVVLNEPKVSAPLVLRVDRGLDAVVVDVGHRSAAPEWTPQDLGRGAAVVDVGRRPAAPEWAPRELGRGAVVVDVGLRPVKL